MLTGLKPKDRQKIAKARKKRKHYSKDTSKIFYLIGSAYGKHNEHHFIFLSADGEDKRYTVSTTYPYFHVRNTSEASVVSKLATHRKMDYVKEIKSELKIDAITQKKGPVVTVSVHNPNNVTSQRYPDRAISQIFDPHYLHNNHVQYFHVVLNDSKLIMGMPYRFVKQKPVMAFKDNPETRALYDEVFAMIPDEVKDAGDNLYALIHAQQPPWGKMVFAYDIEIQANHGESMNPELAEVPITSISVTNHMETRVFTLSNELLGIDPPEDPSIFIDNTFIRTVFDSERELLVACFDYIDELPQKIVVTHVGDGFDIPYTSRRSELLGIQNEYGVYGWEIKGGFSGSAWKKSWFKKWKGKYLVDLYEYFGNGNVRTGAYHHTEYSDLKLDTIAKAILGRGKYEYEGKIEELNSEELSFYNAKDTQLTYDLATHDDDFPAFILFLIMRFGNLSLENANRRGVTAWWGGFMYRYLSERNYTFPNHQQLVRNSPEKLKGGTVLPAKTGVYHNVSILDFSSLYPTMIIQWNICFSTINCEHDECRDDYGNHINIPGRTIWTCAKRIGFMPAVLSFLRNARVNIYKPRGKKKHPEYSPFYEKISYFFKIFMNAAYGCFANYGFPFAHDYAAQATTATSRDKLDMLVGYLEEDNSEPLYGDSVLGTEAVIYRTTDSAERWNGPILATFVEMWKHMAKMFKMVLVDSKHRIPVNNVEIWAGSWNKVTAIIRHFTYKSIFRVATGLGSVDVTEDHSLVDAKGKMFKPQEIAKGKLPVNMMYPVAAATVQPGEYHDRALLMFLFSICGTAAASTNTGYPSQRSVMLQFNQKCMKRGLSILSRCDKAIKTLGAAYNTYTTGKGKLMIKFKSHQRLWKLVREYCYSDNVKRKPYPYIFALPEEELRLVYDFLHDYHWRPDKKSKRRWVINSSPEMVLYSTLAEYFDKGRYTFIPLPRGKGYTVQLSTRWPRKSVVSVVKTTADMVFDLETTDGSFMAGNIHCHNTDSVFVEDCDDDIHVKLTDRLGIEVENEGTFKLFILYLKKNYIKLNPDEKIIMGMTGKKKNNCKLVREAFKKAVDGINVDMTQTEMLDFIYNIIKAGERRLLQREFSMDEVKITQALSKDIDDYKVNTPLVQAANNMIDELGKEGSSRTFGRKGVIFDYVKTDKGTRWMPTQLTSIDKVHVDHYIDQLHRVFTQLTIPLGMKVSYLKHDKENHKLEEFFN